MSILKMSARCRLFWKPVNGNEYTFEANVSECEAKYITIAYRKIRDHPLLHGYERERPKNVCAHAKDKHRA